MDVTDAFSIRRDGRSVGRPARSTPTHNGYLVTINPLSFVHFGRIASPPTKPSIVAITPSLFVKTLKPLYPAQSVDRACDARL
jgi:hypothetical protein